jgi:hypothetical protein
MSDGSILTSSDTWCRLTSSLMTSDSFHSDDGHGMRRFVVMLFSHELWVVAQAHVGEHLQDIHKKNNVATTDLDRD